MNERTILKILIAVKKIMKTLNILQIYLMFIKYSNNNI